MRVKGMYKEHSVFDKPKDEDTKIWRYMDFSKFVSLLDKSALFFSRADKLGDPFEGSFSKFNIKQRPKVYKDKIPEDALRDLGQFHRMHIRFTAINCWHLNKYESAAMWKIYLKSNEGIAIQSTFNLLKNSFKDEKHNIYIGMVKYFNYEKDWIPEGNSFSPYLCKRKSFEHEQELRAIIQETPSKNGVIDFSKPLFEDGLYIKADLDIMIEKVYLAPTSPKWLNELVKSVTSKYGLDKEVLQSSLDDVPVY